jgi:8-oxo-dGTP diphosphatase
VFVDGWWVTAATVKGVVRLGDDVLLGRNSRGEWELPGGRPEPDEESVAATLVREVREETGLDIAAGRLLLAELFEVVPGRRLLVVVLAAVPAGATAALRASEEHSELGWFAIDRLPEPLPELYRRAIDLG